MELVNISQLRPGHIVASAINNSGGAILCPPGFKLTAEAIEHLKNAGIEAVIVESNESREQNIDARIEALHRRFAGIDDPILLQLKATIEKRLNFMRL